MPDTSKVAIVTFEDRPVNYIGMKLLALSLQRCCPDLRLRASASTITEPLKQWFAEHDLELVHEASEDLVGWNIKPTLLRRALEEGATEAVWLDSDIIVTGDPRQLWANSTPGHIAVAEEFMGSRSGDGAHRTRSWNLPVGRSLPGVTNSCVLRVTAAHMDLLKAWEELLNRKDYLSAQARPWHERPSHLFSDQDVLCALLASERFSSIPIRWVRRGSEVAHCFENRGYALRQRVGNLASGTTPLLIHGQGPKPWYYPRGETPLSLQLSPYKLAALQYLDGIGEDTGWAQDNSRTANALRWIFRDHLTATGLPLAVLHEARYQPMLKSIFAEVRETLRSSRKKQVSAN